MLSLHFQHLEYFMDFCPTLVPIAIDYGSNMNTGS